MSSNPTDPHPPGAAGPSPIVNNEPPPGLPPNPYAGQPGWGAPPQPQAPTWPYAPGASPQPGMYQPPGMYSPPGYGMPPQETAPALIGPEHVPWKWYDMLLPAAPLLLGLLATLIGALASNTTQTAGGDKAIGTRELAINTVVGVGIYAFMVAMMWIFAVRKYHVGWSALGVRKPPGRYWALFIPIALGMYVASLIASAVVVLIFYHGKAPENPQVKDLTGGGGFTWTALILALITASVVAPVVEELFFRGMLYGWLRTRWNFVGGVILSGVLFSLAHGIALIFASILVVGITLAIVYEKTKSTIATMALHSLFNTVGVILVFVDLARK
jgi:membrane protease YdiL (CAAX protease family)